MVLGPVLGSGGSRSSFVGSWTFVEDPESPLGSCPKKRDQGFIFVGSGCSIIGLVTVVMRSGTLQWD